jgi:diguanylate cyclase (GGDEF)-like protein
MTASLITSRIRRCTRLAEWPWWRLPLVLRSYVAAPPIVACALIAIIGLHTDWRMLDFEKFLAFTCCGVISVAGTPRLAYTAGIARDFGSIWVLPAAVLLPPVYVAVVSIPLLATVQFWVHRGVLYRRVFTAASISISYLLAATVYRMVPASFAGVHVGSSLHAFTWALAVAGCYILGGRLQHFLIVGAVKLTDPSVRVWAMVIIKRDGLQDLFVEIDLAVLITLVVAVSPALGILAVPLLFLVRRFIIHPALVAQSRVDSKTGLLNVSTWEAEAESELSRSIRTRSALALALIDIDHFKTVNDTYGHLVGDRVLKALAEALTGQSRDYDRAGRFGGEEFVLLLAQTGRDDACKIAERLRGYVAGLQIPIDDRPDAPTLTISISIGVTAMARGETFELTDLLAAADSAMYAAKQAGRDQVAFAPPLRDMGLDAAWNPDPANDPASSDSAAPLASSPLSGHRVVLVENDRTGASLCPRRLLSVLIEALREVAKYIAPATARAQRPVPSAGPGCTCGPPVRR